MALKVSGDEPQKTGNGGYAQHLAAADATAVVKTEIKSGGLKVSEKGGDSEVVAPGLFHSNGMSLEVNCSQTVNLGDFNSAKISVGLRVPCSPDNLNDAYAWALGWCGQRVMSEVASAKGM